MMGGGLKFLAPLGLNAAMHQNSRWDIHRRGGVPPPNGLGDPTPTDSTSLCHLPIFPYPGGTCRPSGALVIWCMPYSINMPPLWG